MLHILAAKYTFGIRHHHLISISYLVEEYTNISQYSLYVWMFCVLLNKVSVFYAVHVREGLCCVLVQAAVRVWPEGDHQADGQDELHHHGAKHRAVRGPG